MLIPVHKTTMYRGFRSLLICCRGTTQRNFKFKLGPIPQHQFDCSHQFSLPHSLSQLVNFRTLQLDKELTYIENPEIVKLPEISEDESTHIDKVARSVQNLLKEYSNTSDKKLYQALDDCGLSLDEGLVLNVLSRHSSDWKAAFRFFNWVSRGTNPSGYLLGSGVCNEMLGILGKMKLFGELDQVFDEMSKRRVMDERSYEIVVHRYAAAHRIDNAIDFFYKRKQYGFELDLIAFQTLLLSLCRYKHVEAAELLFHSKKGEFQYDIKTWNIILNGWCVLGNLRETKRFWNEIIHSKCKPDRITYGIFVNSLCKSGKIGTALKLFHDMWKKGYNPDVVICNSVIDGLCFKKRIPEALQILQEMSGTDCEPNVVTYNCLIKHLCKIQRMEEVFQLLDQMEKNGGNCSPNATTYNHLFKSTRKLEEVSSLLKRMEKNGCKMTVDTYNLLLRLYVKWNCEEKVQSTWAQMVRDGMGPDQRSYTIMIHGLYDQGKIEESLNYFNEMTSKGMETESRTELLVDAMNTKLKERGVEDTSNTSLSRRACRRGKKTISFVD